MGEVLWRQALGRILYRTWDLTIKEHKELLNFFRKMVILEIVTDAESKLLKRVKVYLLGDRTSQ